MKMGKRKMKKSVPAANVSQADEAFIFYVGTAVLVCLKRPRVWWPGFVVGQTSLERNHLTQCKFWNEADAIDVLPSNIREFNADDPYLEKGKALVKKKLPSYFNTYLEDISRAVTLKESPVDACQASGLRNEGSLMTQMEPEKMPLDQLHNTNISQQDGTEFQVSEPLVGVSLMTEMQTDELPQATKCTDSQEEAIEEDAESDNSSDDENVLSVSDVDYLRSSESGSLMEPDEANKVPTPPPKRTLNVTQPCGPMLKTSAKNKKKTCLKCKKAVINLNRHLVRCMGVSGRYRNINIMPHLVEESYKQRSSKTKRRLKVCPLCDSVVVRIDHHLRNKHGLSKGDATYKNLKKSCQCYSSDQISARPPSTTVTASCSEKGCQYDITDCFLDTSTTASSSDTAARLSSRELQSSYEKTHTCDDMESVKPSVPRAKLSDEELLYLFVTAGDVGVTGSTLKDIEEMTSDKTFRHYLNLKYPDTPDKLRFRRIRDILRKFNPREKK